MMMMMMMMMMMITAYLYTERLISEFKSEVHARYIVIMTTHHLFSLFYYE